MMDLWKEKMVMDFIDDGLYKEIDFDDIETWEQFAEEAEEKDRVVKEALVEEKVSRLKKSYSKKDSDSIVDWFIDEIEGMKVVAVQRRRSSSEFNWSFQGYCTGGEFLSKFNAMYSGFQAKYEEYERDHLELRLDVVGGMFDNDLVINRQAIYDLQSQGIVINLFGVSKASELKNFKWLA